MRQACLADPPTYPQLMGKHVFHKPTQKSWLSLSFSLYCSSSVYDHEGYNGSVTLLRCHSFGNMTFDIWAILKNTSKKVMKMQNEPNLKDCKFVYWGLQYIFLYWACPKISEYSSLPIFQSLGDYPKQT
jgi:hypothetical protein